MQKVTLPQKPQCFAVGENEGRIEILGCYPGYGTTLGNALRRVLLSSLAGSAISAVKIRGVHHEFSTIPGVMEDVVQIILNIKKIRLQIDGDEPVKISLKHKGEGKITAKNIKCPTGVKIVNPNQPIVTVTDKKTELEMEFEVTRGLGYVPVEQQERKQDREIGVVAVDAVYTPIRRVNYNVENMRVGKRTDFEKITLDITTDGTVSPQEAFEKAVQILIEQFSQLKDLEMAAQKTSLVEQQEEKTAEEEKKEDLGTDLEKAKDSIVQPVDPLEIKIEELKNLSTRTFNLLNANKILKVKDIVKKSEAELKEIEGMGEKSLKEIKKSIGDFGLTLKQS